MSETVSALSVLLLSTKQLKTRAFSGYFQRAKPTSMGGDGLSSLAVSLTFPETVTTSSELAGLN